jgi:hypothetical protein
MRGVIVPSVVAPSKSAFSSAHFNKKNLRHLSTINKMEKNDENIEGG